MYNEILQINIFTLKCDLVTFYYICYVYTLHISVGVLMTQYNFGGQRTT